MRNQDIAVGGIGNAVLDLAVEASDSDLVQAGILKGGMTAVDLERSNRLLEHFGWTPGEGRASAGGSVANTLAGIARLGLDTVLFTRLRDDMPGTMYVSETLRGGTLLANSPEPPPGPGTSRSLVVVTPDGERSMSTYLGISAEIGPEHIQSGLAARCRIMFLEGYLFDTRPGKAALLKAAAASRAAGGRVGVTLSDPRCIARNRADFHALVADHLDFAVGNAREWEALDDRSPEESVRRVAAEGTLAICTRSGADVLVAAPGEDPVSIPVPPRRAVDTTGAGDQFAAGFLYGYAMGRSPQDCARMGIVCAGEVIGHAGARPRTDTRRALVRAGLIRDIDSP